MNPDQAKHWYDALWPIADRGGPLLTLLLGLILVISLWYGLGILRECVQHNRQLNERILAQQERFYTDLRLALARCDPQR